MARGNCSSMNNEMAGNIMSLVNGLEENFEAAAKELNATSTAQHPTGSENNLGTACQEAPTWNATPKSCVHCLYPISSKFNRGRRAAGQTLTEHIPIFLSILSSSSLRTNNTRRRNACSQAYNLILDTASSINTERRRLLGSTEYTVPPDIRQQFAHQARTLVLALHLLYLKILQEICDHRIQWD